MTFAAPARFALVDLRTRQTRTFDGVPPEDQEISFDSRCDVSLRGFSGNSYYQSILGLDASERFLLRAIQDGDVLEDLATGHSAPVGRGAKRYATLSAAPSALVLHPSLERRPRDAAGPAYVADSSDDIPTTILWDVDDRGLVVEEPSGRTTRRVPLADRRAAGFTTPVARMTHGIFAAIVDINVDGPIPRQEVVVADLVAGTVRARAPYRASVGPFAHMWMSADGSHVVWSERISPAPRGRDEDVRDFPERHTCFLAVLDTSRGRFDRFRTPTCPLLAERPLRIEGRTLVTDATSIPRCTPPIERRYDLGSGTVIAERRGSAVVEDVDAALEAKARAIRDRTWRDAKSDAFRALHGVEVTLWTEGPRVVALRDGALVLCNKRGGECSPPFLSSPPVAIGASLDGTRIGIATTQMTILDAQTGAPVLVPP